jgi:hypothetical protein
MDKEINLGVPSSLYYFLLREADEQGVSLEALCLSLLSGEQEEATLVEPTFYSSLNLAAVRSEVRKVVESDLPEGEVKKRIVALEAQMTRRYIRR